MSAEKIDGVLSQPDLNASSYRAKAADVNSSVYDTPDVDISKGAERGPAVDRHSIRNVYRVLQNGAVSDECRLGYPTAFELV